MNQILWPSIAVKIKVRLQSEKFEWTNTIWKQIDTNMLSITLHQKQALSLLQRTGKRICIPFQIGWQYTELTTIFFVFRQVTLFIHGIFFRYIYFLV